jgi:hypothetical protein
MLGRQPTARLNETGKSKWNRQCEARRYHGPATIWSEQHILAGKQIEASVTLPGIRGWRQIWIQQDNGKVKHSR